jgi:hypothetical protein
MMMMMMMMMMRDGILTEIFPAIIPGKNLGNIRRH